ncbi:PAS domain S-box protein [Fulvivirga sp. RKSG066]|uniref:hybrid sensor histidine kinase/response regulator n=1 Tax=Fulvivirga aurantia TaxID=2529383 RepID=UPI0012BC4953|nr:PAS domain S-box protein [Fulvivirga aurantia]MTI21142.1 PAS domain S-box protein [Fulvivirga aurantia]
MKNNVRILVIEDSVDDYELLVRQVKKGWNDVETKRIETPEELETCLCEDWDAVISDNTLPRFSAITALEQLRKKDQSLPFIIVSGTIGEEVAVEAMKSGANDYILKSDTHRLLPALQRELKEHQRRKEQIKTQKELQESQKRYQLLANNIQDLVVIHEPDSTYIWVSPSVERILGYTPEELIGKLHFDNIHPDDFDPETYENPFDNAEDSYLKFNYRLRRKDGTYTHVETLLQPIYENGTLTQIVSASRDVTEQKLAYNLLAESEERYYSVIDNIAEGVVLFNSEGNILTYNPSAARFMDALGFNFTDFKSMARGDYNILASDHTILPVYKFPSIKTLRTGESCTEFVIGLQSKLNESITWVSVNSVAYEEPNGKRGVVLSFSDITKQKISEERITNAATELKTLIDTANAPIFGIDWHGRINEWNQVCAKITGFEKKEVLGKILINEFILDGYKVAVTDLLKSALRGKNVTNYELPIYTRNGQVVTMLFNATPRRDVKGKVIGVLGVGQDITELIQYRDKLEQRVAERTEKLNEALTKEKELVAMKSKFVSMASHEFRTPLSTISFAADFLSRYNHKISAGEREKKLGKIDEMVKHMTTLLDDVLVMGKSEAGKINMNPVNVHISSFIKKLVEEVEHSTKGTHKIMTSIATEVSEIMVDEKLLRNILINLLSNAIKFSPNHNKVLLDVIYKKGELDLIVKDWGMGISEEDQDKVFEAFHRTNNVGAIQGTGLGLAIVKKAVDIHNGTIKMESELEKGTTFRINIPTTA